MAFECKHCEKKFGSQDSLQQHIKAKHQSIKPTSSIKLGKKHFVVVALLVVLLIGGFLFYLSATSPGQYDEFAQCLTEKGTIFYGAFWCPHCNDQKNLFGKSIQYVNYVECSTPDRRSQTQTCINAGITSYPTWGFADGSKISSVLSLEELSSKSGCLLS